MLDLDGARKALRANAPVCLLELPEQQWLDAKSEAYELKNPGDVEELAKDIAGLANGGGGLIVLGIRTRLVNGCEVLDRVESLDRTAVDLHQMRKLIRQRITPPPRKVVVDWSDDQRGACVVYIDVSTQEPDCLFVVAAPVGKPGSPRTDTVAVPVREADGTFWLPRTEIQRLLSAGIAASGQPTSQALAELVREAVTEARPDTEQAAPRMGQGLPQREREMREAYRQLREVGLGQAAGEAYEHGPAAVQDFAACREGQPEWVLCLVRGRVPVAVPAPVWQAVVDAGRTDAGGDPLAAVGYPTAPDADEYSGQAPWAVEADTGSVDLDGGIWGAGRLLRSGRGVWRWEPSPGLTFHQTPAARNWTARQPPPQLRLRVLVNLPWAQARNLQITPVRRHDLEQVLPYSDLASAVTLLSRRRGSEPPTGHWAMGPHGNTSTSASYSSTVTAPDDRPAVTAAAMIALPHTLGPTVVTCADVLIEDIAAWAAALDAGADTRLDLGEVQALLLAAWQTAAELLPDAVADPSVMRWAAPPTTELRLSAETPYGQSSPGLAALLDLTPLGPTDRDIIPEMAITITASPVMERHERQTPTWWRWRGREHRLGPWRAPHRDRMVLMGDVNLAFDDGSVVRLHLAPAIEDSAGVPDPHAGRREADADKPLELPPGFGSAEPVSINGRAAHALARGGEALAEALRPLGGVLDGIHQSFTQSGQRPNQVTVEFGVTLGSDLGLGVFAAKGEASFTVSATWDFTGSAASVPVPEAPPSTNGAAPPATS